MPGTRRGGLKELILAPIISSLKLPSFGETFPALVTDILSPDEFCIQLATKENLEQLHQLSLEINNHYSATEYPPVVPEANSLYVAQFSQDNEWYRVYTVSLLPNQYAEVYYVDYGNKETLPWSSLRPLLPQFSKDKFYGVQCSLGGAIPNEGRQWSKKACVVFHQNVPLFQLLSINFIDRQHTRLKVDVKSGNTTVSQLLINQGLAKVEPQQHFSNSHCGGDGRFGTQYR